jgi:hypothetical protein
MRLLLLILLAVALWQPVASRPSVPELYLPQVWVLEGGTWRPYLQ